MPRRHSGRAAKNRFNNSKGVVQRNSGNGNPKGWFQDKRGVYLKEDDPECYPEPSPRIVQDVKDARERI